MVSCGRYEASFPPPPEPEAVSALKITIRHIYETTPVLLDSLLPGVSVELYRNAEDRDSRLNRYDRRTTDTAGIALFGRVPDGTWFLLADGDSKGEKTETVILKGGALELLDISLP